ncbi:MAG: cytidylate kinase family protein [Parasporobacterium sp.]|nr:cytidylate kinase family protein [Parasporobacterium sp.]
MTEKKKFNVQLFFKKLVVLVIGLFILAFGIALSSKSSIGVSPSASLSYVLSQIFPFSMGVFTMAVNVVFIIVQILLLRKDYKIINLLQLAVVFVFGYFTDLTLAIVEPLQIEAYWMKLLLSVVSCIVMAIGVFLEVKAHLIVMASEGAISAISEKVHLDFGIVKIILDWGFIILSCAISLIVFHKLNGVREGTVIAAFLVGYCTRFCNKHIHFLDKFLELEPNIPESPVFAGTSYPLVITIERELGCGGHKIGEEVAKRLGIPFYDYAIISETAKEMGLPADEVQKNEERMGVGLISAVVRNNNAETQIPSKEEEIFRSQVKVIRELAAKESCVIVGRLGGYILKGRPNTLNLFFSGDRGFRTERIAKEHGISLEEAGKLVKKEDQSRALYCEHFTGMPWGLAAHYGMTLHTSDYGIDRSTEMVMSALEKAKEYMDQVESEGVFPTDNFVRDVEELTD